MPNDFTLFNVLAEYTGTHLKLDGLPSELLQGWQGLAGYPSDARIEHQVTSQAIPEVAVCRAWQAEYDSISQPP